MFDGVSVVGASVRISAENEEEVLVDDDGAVGVRNRHLGQTLRLRRKRTLFHVQVVDL